MTETIPRFDDFRYRANFDVDTITEAAEAAHANRQYVETGEDGQKLAVYTTFPSSKDGRDRAPVWRPTAFSDDPGRPKEFDALLAHALDRPVLTVNNPGVDDSQYREASIGDAYKLTDSQLEGLQEGSFRGIARASLHALKASQEGLPNGLFIASSSMGAAIAGAALGEAKHAEVMLKGVTLDEVVNVLPSDSTIDFVKRFLAEGKYNNDYLERNGAYPDDRGLLTPAEPALSWLKRVVKAGGANKAYAAALKKGQWLEDAGLIFAGDLTPNGKHALAETDIQFLIARGSESKLSSPEGDHAIEDHLRLRGHTAIQVAVRETHTHPYTMTVQAYVNAVNSLQLQD